MKYVENEAQEKDGVNFVILKRFKRNFKNQTSENKIFDELIQKLQYNTVHPRKCLEWIPFDVFKYITYITRGGFNQLASLKDKSNSGIISKV